MAIKNRGLERTMTEKSKRYESEWSFDFEDIGKNLRDKFKREPRETPSEEYAANVERHTFTVPLENTEHVTVDIGYGICEAIISTLDADSENLFEATIDSIGDITFETSGDTHKTILLKQQNTELNIRHKLVWDIRLHPQVLTSLQISGGVGKSVVDLLNLNVDFISFQGGVGEATLTLPKAREHVTLKATTGVGAVRVNVPSRTSAVLNISGGVGKTVVNVPQETGVMANATVGVGKITMPPSYQALSERRQLTSKKGTWVSPNYDDAAHRVTLRYEAGIGGFSLVIN
jgi:predicted membrane protein